jgi:hypothetical protein
VNPAQQFVQAIYGRFQGRVPLRVGLSVGSGDIYPLVFEDSSGAAIGLIGCAWNEGSELTLVQLYHLSAFKPHRGAGTVMMTYLCALADQYGVRLCVQAKPQSVNEEEPLDEASLNAWYRRFGFKGHGVLRRDPYGSHE